MKFFENYKHLIDNQKHACIVHVPKGVKHSKDLFHCFKIGLKFPEGFGNNWNALDDFLDDLSWLDEKIILIVHDEFPQLSDAEVTYYWDTLRSAVEYWQTNRSKTFVVIFGTAE